MEQEERRILVNQIRTPDGTIIRSRHRHDYVAYTDKNGHHYSVDGGHDYLKRGFVKDYEEMSIFTDEKDFNKIRESLERGGRGVNGDEPLEYVVLKDINDDWLQNIILYEEEHRPNNRMLDYYVKEVEYRKNNTLSADLQKYEAVNKCETLAELAEVILSFEDEMGFIQGRTRRFRSVPMAGACLNYLSSSVPANSLTREFGIRQQAMYIKFYNNNNSNN